MPSAISPDRFGGHFLVRTIRDFHVGLLMTIAVEVELGVRFAVMLWSFNTADLARKAPARDPDAAQCTSRPVIFPRNTPT